MLTVLSARAAEPDRGWGGLIAIVIAVVVFYAGTAAHSRWKATRPSPSPTPGQKAVATVKPKVKGESDSSGRGKTLAVLATNTAVATRPNLDEFVRARYGHAPVSQIIREAKRAMRASESGVYRALRRIKKDDSK